MVQPIVVYTDGACKMPEKRGGWAALILQDGQRRLLHGHQENTTNNRMELTAAIKALEALPVGSTVIVRSDSEYLVKDMQSRQAGGKPRRRNANLDLWRRLDEVASRVQVRWEWVKGHAGQPENEEVNAWAEYEAGVRSTPPGGAEPSPTLTHLDAQGHARQVEVGHKPQTLREAVAKVTVRMRPETLALVRRGGLEKGDALAVARLAGIAGAKMTPHLIPLCHPIPLTGVEVDIQVDEAQSAVHITATARAVWHTGVEMEALTGAACAALALYDMVKGVERGVRITDLRVVRKTGGQSGDVVLEGG
ncbi:MAG: cyclic pyranopterin monophosphate synthase MoaC [Chloroflexota bacterium]|nr:cyclic pyranopterin monophosphate synthase MoaC [Chloroflexota bacterium]